MENVVSLAFNFCKADTYETSGSCPQSLPPTLDEWLCDDGHSQQGSHDEHPQPKSYRLIYEPSLSPKISKAEPALASPLMKIISKQYSERDMSTMTENHTFLLRAVEKAKTVYTQYLQKFKLRSAEFHCCAGQSRGEGGFEQQVINETVC